MGILTPFSVLFVLLNIQLGLTKHIPDVPAEVNRATLNGVTYVNKGLVGFGLIASDFKESTGDTLGGIGSAIALKPNTWKKKGDGTFTGTLVVHPDRGFNEVSTINYQARHHEIDFVLNPYYDSRSLDFKSAQKTLNLKYKKTVLEFDVNRKPTSGLDPQAVRHSFPLDISFPGPLPIVSKTDDRLVLDVEGLIANPDGSFWISDEYGPGIYRLSPEGRVEQAIKLPDALLPRDAAGNVNYTSVVNPAVGRTPNQGFEGLTIDPSTGRLYAMLQSAAIQDSGVNGTSTQYTRLFAFEVLGRFFSVLVGEWVVPLPLSSKGKTRACSEIMFISPGVFLALSRDGNGRGDVDLEASYKNADLFSIRHATDIHGTKFDSHLHPVAVNGVLDPSIKPAEYVPFINYIDPNQLARYGLHNGAPDDPTLLSAKWESFALAPVGDPSFPDDYFLFTACDNDFLTTHGVSLGQPFDAGVDNDNQFMVFRVTLPDAHHGRGF